MAGFRPPREVDATLWAPGEGRGSCVPQPLKQAGDSSVGWGGVGWAGQSVSLAAFDGS